MLLSEVLSSNAVKENVGEFINLIFLGGMFQRWSAMGDGFCEISSTTLLASVSVDQESLKTLYEAVLSRITAQLGSSELLTKTETLFLI